MTPKETALEIAGKLREAEAASLSPELEELHKSLWAGIWRHADILGLTEDDLNEIGNAGRGMAARDGEPKDRPE